MEDIVRTLRVLEYVGPREWVENTLNTGHIPTNGVHSFTTHGVRREIKSALIGNFPEVIGNVGNESDNLLTQETMDEIKKIALTALSEGGTFAKHQALNKIAKLINPNHNLEDYPD